MAAIVVVLDVAVAVVTTACCWMVLVLCFSFCFFGEGWLDRSRRMMRGEDCTNNNDNGADADTEEETAAVGGCSPS